MTEFDERNTGEDSWGESSFDRRGSELCYSAEEIIELCLEVVPDGFEPVPIFKLGNDEEALITRMFQEDFEREPSEYPEGLDNALKQTFFVLGMNQRVRMPIALEFTHIGKKVLLLHGFDSPSGISETFEAVNKGSLAATLFRSKGFLDDAPHRVETSTLCIIRHEARHLRTTPIDKFEMEMMCDGVSLLFRWRELMNGTHQQSLDDFYDQCREQIKHRQTAHTTREANHWLYCHKMIEALMLLSPDEVKNYSDEEIETVCELTARQVLLAARHERQVE